MSQKKIGHVELQWTCPNCGGVNPGREQVCGSCGAPQPHDVEFHQAARQELIEDEALIEKAKAGPDVHCPYCGARNPAGATVCSRCSGDLSEGAARSAGRVVGAFSPGPASQVACANCGAMNPDTASSCGQCGASLSTPAPTDIPPRGREMAPRGQTRPWIKFVVAAGILLACSLFAALLFFSSQTNDLTGVVQSVRWEHVIPIEAMVPVEYKSWQDEVPTDAQLGTCEARVRSVEDQPVENAVEVCGTPYTVDTGGGFAEVVQDCEYQVYDDYCSYTVQEWRQVDQVTLQGDNLSPTWPDPVLSANQKMGTGRTQRYTIVFDTDNGIYNYTTGDLGLFQSANIGSSWTLSVNALGGVVAIER